MNFSPVFTEKSFFLRIDRTGADQCHLPGNHIQELRQFVQTVFAEEVPPGGTAGIMLKLPRVPPLPLLIRMIRQIRFKLRIAPVPHSSEFEDTENFFLLSVSVGKKKDPLAEHHEGYGNNHQHCRDEQNEQKQGYDAVKHTALFPFRTAIAV